MTPKNTVKSPMALGIVGAGVVVIIIIFYSVYAAFPYLAGPSITVHRETENGITTLSGTTTRVSFLEINGAAVPLEESGAYSVKRAFPPGYTTVTAVARDRFGRTITKTISFITEQTITLYGTEEEN